MGRTAVLIVALGLPLWGCAAGGLVEEYAQRPPPDPSSRVVIIRKDTALGLYAYVLLDGELVGAIAASQNLTLKVSPGEHSIGLPSGNFSTRLAVNETRYLVLDVDPWTGQFRVVPAEEKQVKPLLAATEAIGGRRLKKWELPDLSPQSIRKP